jgi:hypothetical protein
MLFMATWDASSFYIEHNNHSNFSCTQKITTVITDIILLFLKL